MEVFLDKVVWVGGAKPAIEVKGVVVSDGKKPFCGDATNNGGPRYAEWKGDGTDCGDPIHPVMRFSCILPKQVTITIIWQQ